MKSKNALWILLAALLIFGVMPSQAAADVVLGQSCALSGPTSFLGTQMNKGALAYFTPHAPGVELKVLDDKYEPDLCIKNTQTFLLQDKVTALFGYVGTPTSKVAVPLATQNKIIYFGAFTGAGFLSDYKTNPYSFSLRASYDAEIESMVRHLKDDLNITQIGLFVQRDAFGLAGVSGAVKAVKNVGGVSIMPEVPPIPADDAPVDKWKAFWRFVPNYKRNTIAVNRNARKLSGNRVQAVIMVGAYRPCARAINLWHKLNFKAVFINISFVGSRGLAERCKSFKNVYISQVVPNPWDPQVPVVKEYQADMGQETYGFISLEAYIAAKTFHKALNDAGATPSSDTIKTSLETMSDYDVGGLKVSFGTSDHRGLDQTYLTKIEKDGDQFKFVYVDKLALEE